MSIFQLYLQLGWQHLTDIQAYDHMLFLLALVAGHELKDWKKLIWLVTAFTVGHSFSLAMAAFGWVAVNSTFVEYGILVSILLLAISRWWYVPGSNKNIARINFLVIVFFGVIHGLGFSNYLSSIASSEHLVMALLGFNVGLELAQISFVCVSLLVLSSLYKVSIKKHMITKVLSVIISIWTLILIYLYQ